MRYPNMDNCWDRIWFIRRRNTDDSEDGTVLIKIVRSSIPIKIIWGAPLPGIFCNLLESTPARIPLTQSNNKCTQMLFIISDFKLGIWICSQPIIDLNSQSNFYDVLTRPYKYLSNTLYKTTCTQYNLHVSFTRL